MKGKLSILILTLYAAVSLCMAQDGEYTLYKVKRKATVETVAFLNDLTPEELLRANPTINPSVKLQPGDIVRIPGKKASSAAPAKAEAEEEDETSAAENAVTPVAAPQVKEPELEQPAKAVSGKPGTIDFDSSSAKIRIAAVLPFEQAKLSESMCEIYSGMLVAASELKDELDKEIVVEAYSTADLSESNMDRMFSDKDIIVGPVFKENFEKVAAWAAAHRKPVVSPLTAFDVESNPYVVVMPPAPSEKMEPLREYLTSDKNVILIEHNTYQDKAQEAELLKLAPRAQRFHYDRETMTPQDLSPLIDPTRLNVFLVPTDHQGAIEDVLSKITAINSPVKICDLAIVGTPQWLNFTNFSQTLLFRGNVSCVASYYYDRQNEEMLSFFDDYINAFERIPSKFSLRGYDIVDIMATALSNWGPSALDGLAGNEFIPLMGPYRFEKDPVTGNVRNMRWVLVSYSSDYSIGVK